MIPLSRVKIPHNAVWNQAHDRKQSDGQNQSESAWPPMPAFSWAQSDSSPVLAAHNYHTVSQRVQKLLIDELNLIDCGPGQSRLAVCSQHHIVRQIYAQRHHILQHQNDRQRQKAAV